MQGPCPAEGPVLGLGESQGPVPLPRQAGLPVCEFLFWLWTPDRPTGSCPPRACPPDLCVGWGRGAPFLLPLGTSYQGGFWSLILRLSPLQAVLVNNITTGEKLIRTLQGELPSPPLLLTQASGFGGHFPLVLLWVVDSNLMMGVTTSDCVIFNLFFLPNYISLKSFSFKNVTEYIASCSYKRIHTLIFF